MMAEGTVGTPTFYYHTAMQYASIIAGQLSASYVRLELHFTLQLFTQFYFVPDQ
jgi:hypothetical protein